MTEDWTVLEQPHAEALIVDVDGFEGPLDLLLSLSRTQKVDLRRISVLQLAEQYMVFVERARMLRIELAADYLVMATWLAYLKSRLLLPPEPDDNNPTADELAAHLSFQLERFEAMREAAARLMARDQLGRDIEEARGAVVNGGVWLVGVHQVCAEDRVPRNARALGHGEYQRDVAVRQSNHGVFRL